jgi:flavorubredoxin
MNALVVYDSQYSNTERIAWAIADALRAFGSVRVAHIDPAQVVEIQGADLLIVGSPTQGWRPTPAMQSFLGHISPDPLRRVVVACFDTRFRMPRWLTGSAAHMMAKKIQAMGVSLLVPPESFFVKGKQGSLRRGELDRAAAWSRQVYRQMEASRPARQR